MFTQLNKSSSRAFVNGIHGALREFMLVGVGGGGCRGTKKGAGMRLLF